MSSLDFSFITHSYGGKLKAEQSIVVKDGYIALVGRNDVGKSTLLQFIFVQLCRKMDRQHLCFIPKNRDFNADDTQPGGESISDFNNRIFQKIAEKPFSHGVDDNSIQWNRLFTYLVNHSNYPSQANAVTASLKDYGLGEMRIVNAQKLVVDNISITNHGSGARCVLPILGAMSDEAMQVIIIDEPEASLEAQLQKKLRDRLIAWAHEKEGRAVIVATHSHLFMNIDEPQANLKVGIDEAGKTTVRPVSDIDELADAVFNALGNSISDLLLPDSFLFVEGASDQNIAKKVAELMNIPSHKCRVIAMGGYEPAENWVEVLKRTMTLTVTGTSPYKDRFAVLVDALPSTEAQKLRDRRTENFFVLPQASLEEYIPDEYYLRAGLDKAATIEGCLKAKTAGKYSELSVMKAETSCAIAAVLTVDDLKDFADFVDALRKATECLT